MVRIPVISIVIFNFCCGTKPKTGDGDKKIAGILFGMPHRVLIGHSYNCSSDSSLTEDHSEKM